MTRTPPKYRAAKKRLPRSILMKACETLFNIPPNRDHRRDVWAALRTAPTKSAAKAATRRSRSGDGSRATGGGAVCRAVQR